MVIRPRRRPHEQAGHARAGLLEPEAPGASDAGPETGCGLGRRQSVVRVAACCAFGRRAILDGTAILDGIGDCCYCEGYRGLGCRPSRFPRRQEPVLISGVGSIVADVSSGPPPSWYHPCRVAIRRFDDGQTGRSALLAIREVDASLQVDQTETETAMPTRRAQRRRGTAPAPHGPSNPFSDDPSLIRRPWHLSCPSLSSKPRETRRGSPHSTTHLAEVPPSRTSRIKERGQPLPSITFSQLPAATQSPPRDPGRGETRCGSVPRGRVMWSPLGNNSMGTTFIFTPEKWEHFSRISARLRLRRPSHEGGRGCGLFPRGGSGGVWGSLRGMMAMIPVRGR